MNYAAHVKYLRALAAEKSGSRYASGPISFGKPLAEYAHERAERMGIVDVTARVMAWGEEGAHLRIDCPFCDGTDELVVTEAWLGERVYFSGCTQGQYRVFLATKPKE